MDPLSIGQDGWYGWTRDSGVAPMVVTSPDPTEGGQSARFEVIDLFQSQSGMWRPMPKLALSTIETVTLNFDIYREENPWLSNLWWRGFGGTPSYGLQWDQPVGTVGQTMPFGFNANAQSVPSITGRWVNLTLVWDLVHGTASSWYDGQLVDHDYPISGFGGGLEVDIWLSHDENAGSGPEVAWIDNLEYVVTTSVPEIDPAGLGSVLALVGGVLGLVERRRRGTTRN